MKYLNYPSMVREFHDRNGILRGTEDDKLVKRLRLMTEETAELVTAMDERNLVEVADASCDLVYVIAGTMDVLGFDQFAGRSYGEFLNRSKGIRQIALNGLEHKIVLQMIGGLTGALSSTYRAMAASEIRRIDLELNDFMSLGIRVAYEYGIPFDDCFTEVHRSNMSKDPLNEFGKGGKGPNYSPPNLRAIILEEL